jgi:acetoacetyl-CoA synthetase
MFDYASLDKISIKNSISYNEILDNYNPKKIEFKRVDFDHPLYIMYSSGTTGVPKCIVHGHGGTLLQHLKEHQLHTNISSGDRVFYFTTCSWMMWNWLVSGLATEATLLLYDGSPFYPDGNVLFDFATEEKMTIFGTSAKFIDAAAKAGIRPRDTHDLSTLKTILSTGSPLMPESFDYVYDAIKADVCLSSIAGGTDIVSCFVGGHPGQPVWRGEIQAKGLGMKVEVRDDQGNVLGPGEKGELTCSKSFPSMPIRFWNDPTGDKYHAAYFDKFPVTPQPGEFVEISRVVLIPSGIIPESDGHGGKRLAASQFPFFPRPKYVSLIVTHLDFHTQTLSLNLASPNRLSGVTAHKAGHNVGAPGNGRKANIRLDRIVNIIKTLRHQWRPGGKYGL